MSGKPEKPKEKREEEVAPPATKTRNRRIPLLRMLRFSLQVIFFILLNAGLFQLASLAFPIPVIPVLSSSAAPGVTAISAFDALQYGLSATLPILLVIGLGVFIISALLVGKAFCAYVCPFGFAQDIVAYLRRPLNIKEVKLSPKNARTASNMKYYILATVLIVASVVGIAAVVGSRSYAVQALGIFSDVPFAVVSPADTLFATIPEMIILGKTLITSWSILLWTRIIILLISLFAAFYIPRAFCRYICPIAALMAPLNRYSLIGLERNVVKCLGEKCKLCEKACPMDVPIFTGPEKRFSKHPQCIMCLTCKDVCKEKSIKFALG
nr:4Fe-4S binding protein [Candidatus Njordarchaeum guaymaensis]